MQLVVYRLIGDLSPAEAITHGYIGQKLLAWQTTKRLMAKFRRPPSSVIEALLPRKRHDLNTSGATSSPPPSRQVPDFAVGDHFALSQAVTDGPPPMH